MPYITPLEKLKPPGYMMRVLRNNYRGKKMSLKELGSKVELSYAQISRIETGKSGYNKDLIDKLCKIFKVRPSILFASNEKEANLLKAYHESLT